jgi:hypothetical protein
MGGFVVLPKESGESVEQLEARFARSLDVFRKKNLKLDRRICKGGFAVYRFHKLQSRSAEFIELPNGDFACYTGTFFYDGCTGTEALRLIYEDFASGPLQEVKIAGNFSLLIYKRGELHYVGDYLGYYQVYVHNPTRVVSNSYLAVCLADTKHRLSKQALFEYIFHGLFVHEETLLADVHILDSQKIWRLEPSLRWEGRRPDYEPLPPSVRFSQVVDVVSSELSKYFAMLARNFSQDIGSALSGGYDTRHMLALLTQAGIIPHLHVYGAASDPDVVIAKQIASSEAMTIEHVDKGARPRVDVNEFRKSIERDTLFFDGIKPLGLIDDGSDLATRLARASHAHMQLNGAGGEIYREIWNISDRPTGLVEFLRMRFDLASYDFCGNGFNSKEYFAIFAEKVRNILSIDRETLTRREAEMLFPLLRNKFAQINNTANAQISDSILPFMEPKFAFPSFDIPIRYKYCGNLHSALIRAANPALARFNSAYGINFLDPVPRPYRVRRMIERHVPLWARLIARKRRSQKPVRMPYYFERAYLESILDLKSLRMAEYVDISKVSSPEILSRVLSVELLLAQL